MKAIVVLASLLLSHIVFCDAYKFFQDLIPNGDNIAHPCLANRIWKGVGHFSQRGGGARNPFGVDFKAAGNKWSQELCKKDSDGDGLTNGQELGDPDCLWAKGKIPARTKNISHPGVCEPISSAACKAKNKAGWDLCKTPEFQCPAIKGANVTQFNITFPETNVSSKITNYVCMSFRLPNDTNRHLIATEPIIKNSNVMHHIILFGCSRRPTDSFTAPQYCAMGGNNCNDILGGWTVGSNGECFDKNLGVLIGPSGYQYLVMQIHWNNPQMRSDYKDSSGLKMYLTTDMRTYNGGMFQIGQRYLEIKPGQERHTEFAACPSDCTSSRLPHSIHLTTVLPHMHYAGRFTEVSHYRNGVKIADLVKYQELNYDEPKFITIAPAAELRKGDSLKMKCVYKTTREKNTLFYGDSTQDEMCFAFFRYYPVQKRGLRNCINYGPYNFCRDYPKDSIDNCTSIGGFVFQLLTKWKKLIDEQCDVSISACRAGCKEIVKKLEKESCWQGWAKKVIEFYSSGNRGIRDLRMAMASCTAELKLEREREGERKGGKPTTHPLDEPTTILIGVSAGIVGLLLITVSVIGLCRAFHKRSNSSSSGEAVLKSKTGIGFDNFAGPTKSRLDDGESR